MMAWAPAYVGPRFGAAALGLGPDAAYGTICPARGYLDQFDVGGWSEEACTRVTRMNERTTTQAHPGEPRLPAAVGVVAAIGLYALLPSALQIGPRFVGPGLELLLFIPLVLADPRRIGRQNRLLRRLSIGLVLLIALSNTTALVLLIRSLVAGDAEAGGQLLAAAGQVWLTNVLVFALAYWELDSGGPVTRDREAAGPATADFRFPQDENQPRSLRSRSGHRPRRAGARSTTSTCLSPTPRRSARPTPCHCPSGPSC